MKIATFNINNITKRLNNLTAWLAREQPDVVCLQELKVEQRAFPADTLRDLGYGGVWLGERSWNGVAIRARDCDPVLTRSSLPGNPDDRQARFVEAAVNGVLIACIYLPNGNPQPGPKFDYKLAWFQRLIEHGAELMKAGVPVILAGDYNVVPAAQDIYPTRSLDKNALIQPQSRQAYARLLSHPKIAVVPLLGILFLSVGLVAATAAIGGVRINTSYSLPLGIYVQTHDHDSRLIEFCPVEPFATESSERGYRTHGTACADGSVPLLKPIVAVAGDRVVLSDEGMRVNGRLLPKTAPLFRDAAGRSLHPWPFGAYVVEDGAVWVASTYNRGSYDSRYMGPIKMSQIRARLRPLWLL